jgi:hypothetical protein
MKKQPMIDSALVTIPVAAKIIGIKASTLRDLIDSGVIPALIDRCTLKVSQTQCQVWQKRLQEHDIPKNNTWPSFTGLRPYEPRYKATRSIKPEKPNVQLGIKTEDFFRKRKNIK